MLTPVGRRGTVQDLLNAYLRKGKVWQKLTVDHCSLSLKLQILHTKLNDGSADQYRHALTVAARTQYALHTC